MFRSNPIHKTERLAWLGGALTLALVLGFNFVSGISERSQLETAYESASDRVGELEAELSALQNDLNEAADVSLANQRCVEKFELLADARNEYLLAGTFLLEEFLSMINYGIVAGDASTIFLAAPAKIEEGEAAVTEARQIICEQR